MVTLSGSDRSVLEKAVLKARDVSEDGVRKRLAAMDLTHEERPAGISDQENELRKALRVRSRHLGRGRVDAHLANNEAVEKGLPFLVEELAYEAWHRMLFARFLAENELLTHPELGIPLSTDDLFKLAAEEGRDPWELAADYAANRLPGLFALKTPLRLATEDRQDLTQILGSLDASLFTASDSLGWVYQFWQAKRKKEVNAAGNKIDGNTLPAVTQLFTEDYMVDFLLQNSLGAWYVARHPETPLKENWPYLRYMDDGAPAGAYPTWPDDIAEVTVMDPCCGSGHFLVAALHMLVDMRMEVEGISASDATDRVLQHNLFGLELDARCTQIATFAVALEAWKRGGHPERHLPQITCSGIPVGGQKDEWIRLARNDATLINILGDLYDRFSQAAELGSLIDPRTAISIGDLWKFRWTDIESRIAPIIERQRGDDVAATIFTDSDLSGTVRAGRLLAGTYTLVATNVPYLSRGSQDDTLKLFADRMFPDGRNDLATMFLERCLDFVAAVDVGSGGTVAVVTPQNWLFLVRYSRLRVSILTTNTLHWIARLGEHSFHSAQAAGAFTAISIVTRHGPSENSYFADLDATSGDSPESKSSILTSSEFRVSKQIDQTQNPDYVITSDGVGGKQLLSELAYSYKGLLIGDGDRFYRSFWEIGELQEAWEYFQSTVRSTVPHGGKEQIIFWEKGEGQIADLVQSVRHLNHSAQNWQSGRLVWGKRGIAVSQMRDLPVSLYSGDRFDNNVAVIFPNDPDRLPAIWAFCSSPEFNIAVRKIDSKLNVTNATLVKVPFDLEYWQKVADEQYPNGLPEPYSSDPTQWLFEGTVPESDHPLQVAMARMLGYRWPEQVEDGLDALADPDGIVCLPSVYQESPAHQRLLELLQRAYGAAWSNEVLTGLLQQVDAASLETWLADKNGFFLQHTKLFHNRPFLWQITDGRKDGFSAIVNYHRLDSATLNKLIHTYLGDWIQRQQRAAAQGEAGAQGRLEAATALKAKLDAIYAGEPPYDIYVRWKPLAEQSIGWNPDLNDGFLLNARPFIEAGVLPAKIKGAKDKDRGKDPFVREEPLLADTRDTDLRKRLELHCSVDRWNDLHFSRAEKERARALASLAE